MPTEIPTESVKLSKRQRQRRNQALRKAGIAGSYGQLAEHAETAVSKRCHLAELMQSGDAGQRQAARSEYKRISGGGCAERVNLRGWYKGDRAKGRKTVTDRSDLIDAYQRRYA